MSVAQLFDSNNRLSVPVAKINIVTNQSISHANPSHTVTHQTYVDSNNALHIATAGGTRLLSFNDSEALSDSVVLTTINAVNTATQATLQGEIDSLDTRVSTLESASSSGASLSYVNGKIAILKTALVDLFTAMESNFSGAITSDLVDAVAALAAL